jgi:cephalosporin-C deacetylase-like acetyl esterase
MPGSKRLGSATFLTAVLALLPCQGRGDSKDLAGQLRELDAAVLPGRGEEARQLGQMLARDVRARRQAANERETRSWKHITTRAEWECYRDVRLQALRASLGTFPEVPRDLKVRVTGTLQGDGYRVDNLVFESRPGLVVTANLYRPARPAKSMPGILICHSHHNPKEQAELQDMGMTWARLGCLVLVLDQIGHGERRQHPFRTAKDYPRPFAVGRQDYYFRYNEGVQLQLVGDSLIGWMVWDLMRGVDLLLSRPGIDKQRIILLGAVAGGGDPAAVTAALDRRITAVVPFNFGGPQPETRFPLPADAAITFNYAGGGSWESTRNLRLSARDGFMPWVIVGSAAPRWLVYAHEFAWDRQRDPVWARLEKIYGFYNAAGNVAESHGRGSVSGKPPQSTHCNNIGPEHRQPIYAAFKRWFRMPIPEAEHRQRRPAQELICLTPEAVRDFKPRPVHELVAQLGADRAAAARQRLAKLPADKRRRALRREWRRLLGDGEPSADTKSTTRDSRKLGTVIVERVVLRSERDIVVPLLLLRPIPREKEKPAVVVGLAQGGKQQFLRERPEVIARLLAGGMAVCLPDVRGVGETSPGGARGRTSASTALSSSELMLGQTLLGARLRDLAAVLRYLRGRSDLDRGRIALWGDSFAPINPPDRNLQVPLDAEKLPGQAEPLGGLLALFGALFDDRVRAVYVHGGLTGFQSILNSPFCYVPHDIIVPGALTAGDLCDVAAALAPRPLRLEALVDGLNRKAIGNVLEKTLEPAKMAYRGAKAAEQFAIIANRSSDDAIAGWLLARLK